MLPWQRPRPPFPWLGCRTTDCIRSRSSIWTDVNCPLGKESSPACGRPAVRLPAASFRREHRRALQLSQDKICHLQVSRFVCVAWNLLLATNKESLPFHYQLTSNTGNFPHSSFQRTESLSDNCVSKDSSSCIPASPNLTSNDSPEDHSSPAPHLPEVHPNITPSVLYVRWHTRAGVKVF